MLWTYDEDGNKKWKPDPDSWRYRDRADSLPLFIDRSLGERIPDYTTRSPSESPSPPYGRSSSCRRQSYNDPEVRELQTIFAPDEDPYADFRDLEVADPAFPPEVGGGGGNDLPSTLVCTRCHGITIQSIMQEDGYHHSSLKNISLSASSCEMCRLIIDSQGEDARTWAKMAFDRYQVFITLQIPIGASAPIQHDRGKGLVALWIETKDTTPELGDPYMLEAAKAVASVFTLMKMVMLLSKADR